MVILVERDADQPSKGSLGALAVARALADAAGATVYALCCLSEEDDLERWAEALGAAGADRVAAARWPGAAAPLRWGSHGPVIADVCRQLGPRLVLAPAPGGGADIAPRLAARLGAAYTPYVTIDRGEPLAVSARQGDGRLLRHRLSGTGARCVATVAAPPPEAPLGTDDIDILFFAAEPPPGDFALADPSPDPGAALERARVVVSAGGGVTTAADLARVAALARALGGELAGTRRACALGHVPPSRVVGIDGRHLAPALYVAVAASGSPAHLGAIAPGTAILAINRDPAAPIFAAARHGLVGELGETIDALLAELER